MPRRKAKLCKRKVHTEATYYFLAYLSDGVFEAEVERREVEFPYTTSRAVWETRDLREAMGEARRISAHYNQVDVGVYRMAKGASFPEPIQYFYKGDLADNDSKRNYRVQWFAVDEDGWVDLAVGLSLELARQIREEERTISLEYDTGIGYRVVCDDAPNTPIR